MSSYVAATLPTEKQLARPWSATAIMAVNKGRDSVRRLDQSLLRLVGEYEADMMIAEVVRAPCIHRRDGHIFFLEEPTAKVSGGDAEGLDVRDKEVAAIRNHEPHALDRSQPSDQRVAAALVGLHGLGNVPLRTRESRGGSRLRVPARHDPIEDVDVVHRLEQCTRTGRPSDSPANHVVVLGYASNGDGPLAETGQRRRVDPGLAVKKDLVDGAVEDDQRVVVHRRLGKKLRLLATEDDAGWHRWRPVKDHFAAFGGPAEIRRIEMPPTRLELVGEHLDAAGQAHALRHAVVGGVRHQLPVAVVDVPQEHVEHRLADA